MAALTVISIKVSFMILKGKKYIESSSTGKYGPTRNPLALATKSFWMVDYFHFNNSVYNNSTPLSAS